MSWEGNMFQTEGQDKTPEELTEVEGSNLLEKEFKVMIIKMIKELRKGIDEWSHKPACLNKDLENIKMNQREWIVQ